jgi:hypothetical protein
MELFGGNLDVYVPEEAFDYGRLFDKLTYSDGAFTENYISQAITVYDADPAAFLRALSAWAQTDRQKKVAEHIALNFAYWYQNSGKYLKILFGLLDAMPDGKQRETVQLFINTYQKVQGET